MIRWMDGYRRCSQSVSQSDNQSISQSDIQTLSQATDRQIDRQLFYRAFLNCFADPDNGSIGSRL